MELQGNITNTKYIRNHLSYRVYGERVGVMKAKIESVRVYRHLDEIVVTYGSVKKRWYDKMRIPHTVREFMVWGVKREVDAGYSEYTTEV